MWDAGRKGPEAHLTGDSDRREGFLTFGPSAVTAFDRDAEEAYAHSTIALPDDDASEVILARGGEIEDSKRGSRTHGQPGLGLDECAGNGQVGNHALEELA
jgi:hypothetical protein